MHAFADFNPFLQLIYFASAAGIVMFSRNPVIAAVAFSASLAVRIAKRRGGTALSAAIVIASAVINALFSHNGKTVLFFMNDTPVTLEALLYGAAAGAAIAAVLNISRTFAEVMTSDRLLYIFGRLSPKTALMLSLTLRYIPLLSRRTREVREAQAVMGGHGDGSLPDRIRGGARVFSIMLTWALENGVTTADSMTARGFGVARRTYFSPFRFRRADVPVLAAMLALAALTAVPAASGTLDFGFYPSLSAIPASAAALTAYAAYAALILIPLAADTVEVIKWNCLKSKI